jgi:hypothetical protein
MSGASLRFVNTLILVLIIFLCLTGVYGLIWHFPSFMFDVHRIAGWALILLIPWKVIISLRSLRRGLDLRFDRNIVVVLSFVSAVAAGLILVFGQMWKWNLGEYYVWIGDYGYSAIGWHWGIALYFLLPLFALHSWRRWPHPKRTDFITRRQALKLIGLGIASIAAWRLSETLAKARQSHESPRRFTGSREQGSFAGNAHPITTGPGQGEIKLDPETWALRVTGAVQTPLILNYADALALSTASVIATLDCTGGWYTVQSWRGIPLTTLLDQAVLQPGARGIVLRGVLDYTAPFTLAQADEILLATHVGEEALNHSHGFPMRAVVPSRRGWHWVKWLTEIEVIASPIP